MFADPAVFGLKAQMLGWPGGASPRVQGRKAPNRVPSSMAQFQSGRRTRNGANPIESSQNRQAALFEVSRQGQQSPWDLGCLLRYSVARRPLPRPHRMAGSELRKDGRPDRNSAIRDLALRIQRLQRLESLLQRLGEVGPGVEIVQVP